MKKNCLITLSSVGVVAGCITGTAAFLHQAMANRYFHYGMTGLIADTLKRCLNRHVPVAVLVAWLLAVLSAVFVLVLRRTPGRPEERSAEKQENLRTALIAIGCLAPAIVLAWTANSYIYHLFPEKFYVASILTNILIVVLAASLGFVLKGVDWQKLVDGAGARISGSAAVAVLVLLAILNAAATIAGNARSPEGPNIVLIAVDTLRADHLSCYGYERNTSPEIDSLAGEGVLFLRCLSHIPATTPSFATIFTSKKPVSHGVLDNSYVGFALDSRHLTLAEVLKNHGYETAAFVSGYTLKSDANLAQGFDVYNDDLDGGERKAESVNADALQWLEQRKDSRFFLFLHYFDPHGRYEAPSPYSEMFPCTNDGPRTVRMPIYQGYEGITAPSFYIAQYDGEIRYADHHVGQVIERLKQLNIADETLVIFTSDHGEGLDERIWWFDHGCFVYEEQIRVPLILWYPEVLARTNVEQAVTLADVFPTILDVVGIDPPDGLEGRSLVPAASGRDGEGGTVFCEGARGSPRRNPGMVEGIPGKQFAAKAGNWKLMRTAMATGLQWELFDIEKDPRELNNLAGKGIPVEEELREELTGYIEEYRSSRYYLRATEGALKRKADGPAGKREEDRILRSIGYAR